MPRPCRLHHMSPTDAQRPELGHWRRRRTSRPTQQLQHHFGRPSGHVGPSLPASQPATIHVHTRPSLPRPNNAPRATVAPPTKKTGPPRSLVLVPLASPHRYLQTRHERPLCLAFSRLVPVWGTRRGSRCPKVNESNRNETWRADDGRMDGRAGGQTAVLPLPLPLPVRRRATQRNATQPRPPSHHHHTALVLKFFCGSSDRQRQQYRTFTGAADL
ncbi:hypothetical protein BKA80DRAFT_35436 [Phyllosticta citrichinensis]